MSLKLFDFGCPNISLLINNTRKRVWVRERVDKESSVGIIKNTKKITFYPQTQSCLEKILMQNGIFEKSICSNLTNYKPNMEFYGAIV